MARPTTTVKVGRGPCPECGETITFRRSAGGLLAHKCDNCDSTGFCEPGGRTHAKRMAALTEHQDPATAPAATPTPSTPAPTTHRVNSVFSLANL
jgi:predicted RNA-binding Zn-ribbon protein involved in translation (DUF1610 family)